MDALVMTIALCTFLLSASAAVWSGVMWRFERKYSAVARRTFHAGIAFSSISAVAMILLSVGASSIAVLVGMVILAVAWQLYYRKITRKEQRVGM